MSSDVGLNMVYSFKLYRIIRLNSPNLNYLIIFGSIFVYLSCIVFVIPTLDPAAVSALCVVSLSVVSNI